MSGSPGAPSTPPTTFDHHLTVPDESPPPPAPPPDRSSETVRTMFTNWKPHEDNTVRAKDLQPGYRIRVNGQPHIVKSISNFLEGSGHSAPYTRVFFNDGSQTDMDQYKSMGYEPTDEHVEETSLVDIVGTRDLNLISAIHKLKWNDIEKYTSIIADYESGIAERRASATSYIQELQRTADTKMIINNATYFMPDEVYGRYETIRERCEDYGLPSAISELYLSSAKERLRSLGQTRDTQSLIESDITDATFVCQAEMNYLMALLSQWSRTGGLPFEHWRDLRFQFQDPLKNINVKYPAADMLLTIVKAYSINQPDMWHPDYDMAAFVNTMRTNTYYKTTGVFVPDLSDEGLDFQDVWTGIISRLEEGRTEISPENLGDIPSSYHLHAADSMVDSGGNYDPSLPLQIYFYNHVHEGALELFRVLMGKDTKKEVYEMDWQQFVRQMVKTGTPC